MKITKAEIVVSAVKPEQYPNDQLPHFALAGRSNVGKSSFINKMLNRKNLARTSSKPGKTQTLNFFNINDQFYFVDVPGYGFAKVSKKEREAWGKMIETYLTTSKNLRAVIEIVDIRHQPTEDDKLMYNFCKHYEIPVIIIATKADKIPRGKWDKHVKIIKDSLQLDPNDPLIIFSSETGRGKDDAWAAIQQYMYSDATDVVK
ncbi:ribosome biogenesis GTP-binding protein YihA/YsxC [Calidifontibacillus erzurumensis]|uniref:Probable GTP-binding protein EngB n=1 Tax=Calidifontibacillus erzurumensis TaxID=2741433 RepID=A0A8J8KC09_9BACI|nr:ribosome biogenesis GTP-binding protein YihA/YsxC [Calidifontibacillus erzurumensis]NSL51578.1 YihA family ribosome biogenesis GTP-binding protein [Calidifontibacillus erzurumensis]